MHAHVAERSSEALFELASLRSGQLLAAATARFNDVRYIGTERAAFRADDVLVGLANRSIHKEPRDHSVADGALQAKYGLGQSLRLRRSLSNGRTRRGRGLLPCAFSESLVHMTLLFRGRRGPFPSPLSYHIPRNLSRPVGGIRALQERI